LTCRLKSNAEISLFIEIAPFGAPYFAILPPPTRSQGFGEALTLHIRILRAFDIPSMDLNGKSDPYIALKLRFRK
jgi:hypothetical protein